MSEEITNFEIIQTESSNYSLGSSGINENAIKNPAFIYLTSLGSKFSRNGMKNALLRFAKFFGFQNLDDVPWERINVASFNLYKTQLLKEGRSPNTINTYLAAIRGVIKAAWQIGLISDHEKLILSTVKPVRGSRSYSGRALSQIETSKLISFCKVKNEAIDIRDIAIISLGIGCGLRRNELSELKLDDINFSEQSIRVIGKGNKERIVCGSEIVFIRLKDWINIRSAEGCPEVFVRIGKHGDLRLNQKLSPMAIFKMLQKRAQAVGLEKFTPHDLRRTFATRMLDVGADISIVKEAMGHSSINTTQRYDRRGLEKIREYSRSISV